MGKKITILSLAAAMIVLLSGMTYAAPSFLGINGNIFTPNDMVLQPGDFTANFHTIDLDDSVSILGANLGVSPNLDVGIARFDSDAPGADVETVLSAKYLLAAEKTTVPSVVIGVVDAAGSLDPNDDPGLFLVLGKNLTPAATGIMGEPVRPIRGYLGLGTGIYNGFFLAAEWTFSDRARLVVEYLNEIQLKGSISESSVFNAGVKFAISDSLRGDVALIDSEDLGFGLSYSKLVNL